MTIRLQPQVDVLVVGGGPAGIMAALAAARMGSRTVLVEREGFVGAHATMGLPLNAFHNNRGEQIVGGIPWEVISRLKDMGEACEVINTMTEGPLGCKGAEFILRSIPVRPEAFKYVALDMLSNAGVEVLLHSVFCDVLMTGNSVGGVVVETKSGREVIPARCVVDCSGDGDVAAIAGAPYEKGRRPDGLLQPMTNLFVMSNVDLDRAEKTGNLRVREMQPLDPPEEWRVHYRKCDVKLGNFKEQLAHWFPGMSGLERGFQIRNWGDGVIYAGNMVHIPGLDGSDRDGLSEAEIRGKRFVWRLVEFVRTYVPGFENSHLITSYNIGIRETRRILGDYYLTYEDVLAGQRHEDDIVLNGYFVDIHDYKGDWLHIPERGTQVKDHGSYGIPYRCLLPQKVEGLLVAGRCLSASHEAHSSARVMGTCMGMGHAAGAAASLAAQKGITPRELDPRLLRETLLKQGAIL